MRTLNQILAEMKALVEELETHIGTSKTMEPDLLDDQHTLAGSMDNMNNTMLNHGNNYRSVTTTNLGTSYFNINSINK
jgi:hypothetical protein